jgi:hypothetical protein
MFRVEREQGADWKIVDENGVPCATGLDQDEAEKTAKRWNEAAKNSEKSA